MWSFVLAVYLVLLCYMIFAFLDDSEKFVWNMANPFRDILNGLKFFIPKKKTPPVIERYKEYETAPAIDKIWFDHKAIGTCDICGLSDCPVVKMFNGVTKCKWCAEWDNLTYHLRYNGTRRFLSEKNNRH